MNLPSDIRYVMEFIWKPGEETYISLTKNSQHIEFMDHWFETLESIDIGPFKGVCPYLKISEVENHDDRYEYLFTYETIDRSKLTQHHLGF